MNNIKKYGLTALFLLSVGTITAQETYSEKKPEKFPNPVKTPPPNETVLNAPIVLIDRKTGMGIPLSEWANLVEKEKGGLKKKSRQRASIARIRPLGSGRHTQLNRKTHFARNFKTNHQIVKPVTRHALKIQNDHVRQGLNKLG